MIDIDRLISENDYLSIFKWGEPLIVNHTFGHPKPNFNVDFNEGVYIYINQKQQFLYVGESERLEGRLNDHYKELKGTPSLLKKYKDYCDFFQEYQDENMVIITTQLKEKKQRTYAEEYIKIHLQPEFINFRFNKFFNF
ncbi:putative GIY-YIG superfamily endonuclease [Bacillus sp. SLBN-46]|uniref:GIY-YIG nuclease family protein n=1 Tax=Bacillus sp. SLBN-46 TaxID=3042283 RepID=UPI00285CF04E|nr:GIY-YIG nuclease family protein [Bacillus sp. SLBN-46]MDR6124046.1 putative GIY-YIG superfamily endonuclease [Bacillus sp. SLBN-46]